MSHSSRNIRHITPDRQGIGRENQMHIPNSSGDGHLYYEHLNDAIAVTRTIHHKTFTFLIEPTLRDYTHCATVDDIARLISLLPAKEVTHIDLFILRQPTRKQKLLCPVWGRLALYFETEEYAGVAIILEAQQINHPIHRSKSIDPDQQKELIRLEHDGHKVSYNKRDIVISTNLESCRTTLLFRTISHEVGHYIDYQHAESSEDYNHKLVSEREAFAHRYSDDFIKKMEVQSLIPFSRLFDEQSLKHDNLDPDWFL